LETYDTSTIRIFKRVSVLQVPPLWPTSPPLLLQGYQKVTKPTLRYSLMAGIQSNSTALINRHNTVTTEQHTKVTWSRQPVNSLLSVEMHRCFRTTATSVHRRTPPAISFLLKRRNEFRDTFPGPPVQKKLTICRLVNSTRDSISDCTNHDGKGECLHH
jgi:hypothetical protein